MNVEYRPDVNWFTFLLAMVAGFCDTATFVGGGSIFSAHITGNFIVFAAQIVSESKSAGAWIKLLTFPVFVTAVLTGGWVVERSQRKHRILLFEGVVLTLAGIAAILLPTLKVFDAKVVIYLIVMTTVFGMGLQNAFGKLFAGETFGPTTMMTGNVTQAALDLGKLIRKGGIAWASFKKQGITIGAFLTGCVIGALLSTRLGLSTIIIPGLAITLCYLLEAYRGVKK
jgi:uncharacterized membrane protein YoaK (UPF0700 family)